MCGASNIAVTLFFFICFCQRFSVIFMPSKYNTSRCDKCKLQLDIHGDP